MPVVGVVIPTLNEADYLPPLLEDLAAVALPLDIVVADGGSRDDTRALAAAQGARVVEAAGGRGMQLRTGAQAASGAWLCFLHADVRLPPPARRDLERAVLDPDCDAAVWRLAIGADGWWFRVVEWGAARRDRWGGLPYGDQGLLVRRTLYDAVGGFPPLPIMEDVALVRALRRQATLRRLPSVVRVSARRWRREGAFRAWLRNAVLVSAYLLGVAPERLVRWYRPDHANRPSALP